MSSRQKDEWVEQNPLRVWRTEHNKSQHWAGAQVRVSLATIQNWERGTSSPRRQNMRMLEQLTRDPLLESKWNGWAISRPACDDEEAEDPVLSSVAV